MPTRLWSSKVIRVLDAYTNNPGCILFGITGDIDNLGIFVSKKGRPLAENLVDIYNHLLGEFLTNFVSKHSDSILAFCLIPSGEEIFAIGISNSPTIVEKLFSTMNDDINKFINKNCPIKNHCTSISFGCSTLNNTINIEDIKKLLSLIKNEKVKPASLMYLKIMLAIRTKLAFLLDKSKFRTLHTTQEDYRLVIFFRNIIYYKLQQYKRDTKKLLATLNNEIIDKRKLPVEIELVEKLSKNYGITDSDTTILEEYLLFSKSQ